MGPLKRPAASGLGAKAAARAAKKAKPGRPAKSDPAAAQYAQVLGGIREASVPTQVVQLFGSTLEGCLLLFKEERHKYEESIVAMAGDVLQRAEVDLTAAIAEAQAEIGRAEAEQAAKETAVSGVEAKVKAKEESARIKKYSLADDARAFQACKKALERAELERTVREHELQSTEKQREHYVTIKDTTFKPLLNGTEEAATVPAAVERLRAALKKFGWDEAVLNALPTALGKPPSERGSFETTLVKQLDEDISKRVEQFDDTLEKAEAARAADAAAVQSAAADLEKATTQQMAGADGFIEAQRVHDEACEELEVARKALRAMVPKLRRCTREVATIESKLEILRRDSLPSFKLLRDRTAPPAAPAEQPSPSAASSEAAAADAQDAPVEVAVDTAVAAAADGAGLEG